MIAGSRVRLEVEYQLFLLTREATPIGLDAMANFVPAAAVDVR
jgi:hypothetical protein